LDWPYPDINSEVLWEFFGIIWAFGIFMIIFEELIAKRIFGIYKQTHKK